MERISKEIHNGKTIVYVDFSGLKEREMIALLDESVRLVAAGVERKLMLVRFDEHGFVTPAFMRRAEQVNKEYAHLIQDQAFIGLTEIKKFILKGFNLFLGKNYRAFDSKEEAMKYLLGENKDK